MAKKIALVVDDLDVLDMLQMVFESNGYETVRCRPSQLDCLLEIARAKPDVILLDVPLGRPAVDDALKLIDAFRADSATRDIPIVVCATLNKLLRAKFSRIAAMGCDIVPKPFEISYLLNIINQNIQKAKAA